MDMKQIENLIALMVENDLNRIEIQEGETHILLRRGLGTPVTISAPPTINPGAAAPAPVPTAVNAPSAPEPTLIRSPMVGTFYAGSDPESPPFVKVGDVVSADSVVCLVEAMKVFNEIKAEVSGRITRALVANGEAVEFDQPLFAVEPA